MLFAAFNQNVVRGDILIFIVSGKGRILYQIHIIHRYPAGIFTVVFDDSRSLHIILAAAFKGILAVQDVDFHILIQSLDKVDRFLGQSVNLIGSQVHFHDHFGVQNPHNHIDDDHHHDKQDRDYRSDTAVFKFSAFKYIFLSRLDGCRSRLQIFFRRRLLLLFFLQIHFTAPPFSSISSSRRRGQSRTQRPRSRSRRK